MSAAAGDYRLGTGSPCVDAGNSARVPGDLPVDLDGLSRVVDDPSVADTGPVAPCVDMGAYERGATPPSGEFVRGDCNADGSFGIADAVRVLVVLFEGVPVGDCPDACDGNDDGGVDISDAVTMLSALFVGGGPLPEPIACGADPTLDAIDCLFFAGCP